MSFINSKKQMYKTYKEAHENLRIPGSYQRGTIGTPESGVQSLKITDHPNSYDQILENGERILYVGKGNKTTPAHPVLDQNSTNQNVFKTSIWTKTPFPILHKLAPNHVELLGYYIVKSIKKTQRKGVYFYYAELERIK